MQGAGDGDERETKGLRFFLESRKKQRTCVWRKSQLDENREWPWPPAPPPAAGKIHMSGSAQASSVHLNIFPSAVLRTSCADFIGVPRGRDWVRKSSATLGNSWRVHSPKGFSLRRGSAEGGGEVQTTKWSLSSLYKITPLRRLRPSQFGIVVLRR